MLSCLTGPTACTAQPVEADTDEITQQADIIDGKAIAQTIRKEVAAEVVKLREKYGKVLLGGQGGTATFDEVSC